MQRKFLEELGLEKDVIDKIMAENGSDIEKIKADRDNYKSQLETAQEALKGFEGVDVKELNGKIAQLNSDLAAKDTEYQQKIADMEFNSVLYTVGHEVTHFIQDYSPAAYEDLRNYVIEHINKAAENGGADIAQQIAGKVKFYEAMGQSLTEEEALDEIVAEYFCDMLDNNELIGQMAAENYNLFEKVCKALSDFIERISNTLHELMSDPRLKRDAQKYRGVANLDSDFAEMQALWNTALEQAVSAHSQVDGEVNNENVVGDRYALSDNFDEEFDKAKSNDEYYQNNVLVLGKLPKLFAKFGLNTELYLTITAKHIRDITTEKSKNNTAYHGLTKDKIKKALLNLEKPAFIISSHKNDGTIIAVTTEQDSEGLPISIYVKPNGNAYINGVSETTNHATSIYARDNTYNYIKKSLFDSRVLDINEKEVNRLENILGVYFPDNILSVDFNKSIAYYKTLVNRDYAQNSENNTNSVDEGKYSFGDEDEQYLQAVQNGDTETAQKLVDEAAKRAGYDIKAYHGTARADRVGNVFLPERATSRPMKKHISYQIKHYCRLYCIIS